MPEGITLKRIIDMDEAAELTSSDYALVDSATGGPKKFALGNELSSLKEDYTTILNSAYVTDTASGSIASFSDGADNVPVKSLTVAIEPVQDLHGYESPWPAGGGKNLLPNKTGQVGSAQLILGDDANALASATGIYLKSGTYTITVNSSKMSSIYIYAVSDGSNWNPGNTSASRVITIESDGYYFPYLYNSTGISESDITSFQLESGSTATAYAPYENICPISGYDTAKVTRTGKNLLAKPFVYYSETSATIDDCFFVKAGQYIFHFDTTSATSWRFGIRLMDKDGNFLSDSGHNPASGLFYNASVNVWLNGANVTIKEIPLNIVDDCYIRIVFANGDTSASTTVTGAHLEVGSTATAYEPYQGQTVIIDLGGTIYGGTLNVLTGVLTVDRTIRHFSGSASDAWVVGVGGGQNCNRAMIALTDALRGVFDVPIVSNMFTFYRASTPPIWHGETNNNGVLLLGVPTDITDNNSMNAWASSNPFDVVYYINEPFEVQLTANEISTLLGQNNIWSDAGDVDVEYRADMKLYIEKLTAPTEDDMIADHPISANSFFMVGNSLYRATTAIASGATITVGTNATKMSLSDALNTLS